MILDPTPAKKGTLYIKKVSLIKNQRIIRNRQAIRGKARIVPYGTGPIKKFLRGFM